MKEVMLRRKKDEVLDLPPKIRSGFRSRSKMQRP